jgi:hypothetical protein
LIGYLILVAGFSFGTLALLASEHAKKNNVQHLTKLGLYVHLASTASMYALTAWGVLTLEWWSPFLVFVILYQLLRIVVTSSNWKKYFDAIPMLGGLTATITCGAWANYAFTH